MNEDEPWDQDDAPAGVGELLRAARDERPTRRSVAAAFTAVTTLSSTSVAAALQGPLAGPTTAGAGTIGVTAKGAVGLSLAGTLKWGLGGILLGSLVSAGSVVVRRTEVPAHSAAHVSSASFSKSAPPAMKTALAPMVSTETPPAIASAAEPPSRVASRPAAAASAKPARTADDSSRLDQELALIDAVRISIDARETSRALALLDTHERRFGRSAPLSPEARYLRMEALRASGQAEAARDAARAILSSDAGGPHRERAKTVLEHTPE